MRALIDTHVLLWWATDSGRLSQIARDTISEVENQILWSTASTWELAIKASLNRITIPGSLDDFLASLLREQAISVLPIQQSHALRVALLPPIHRDPFDRMLVAQAAAEDIPLITADRQLSDYEVSTIW